eukprot:scpid48544/ scgid20497/ INO80 complex subunit D
MSGEEIPQSQNGRRDMYVGSNVHFSPIDGKPLCSYSQKLCKQRRLNGFAFCIRHVLEDPHCDFKQCAYVAKYNGNRCTNPIPTKEDRVYCNSHLQVLGILPKTRKRKHGEPEMSPSTPGSFKMKKLLVPAINHQAESSFQAALAPKSVGTKRSKLLSAEIVNNDLNQLLSHACMNDLQTRLHEEREATGEKDLLPLVSCLSDDEEEAAGCGYRRTADLVMRSDLPRTSQPPSLTIATEGCSSEGNVTSDTFAAGHVEDVATLHQDYAERCQERLRQLRQDGVQSSRVYRHCHRNEAIDKSVTRGLIAASRKNTYAASILLLRHRLQTCRKLSRKSNRTKPLKHCAYIQPNNIYCGFDRLPFSRFCSSHASHDARQVLFNNHVDWNSVSWSETLPLANPPEPLGRSPSTKVAAKTPARAVTKMPARLSTVKQERSRTPTEADEHQRLAEEPRRPGRGRGGGRGRGRGAGRGSAAASRLTASGQPSGRGKGPVGRPPGSGTKGAGPGGRKKAVAAAAQVSAPIPAPPPLMPSTGGKQKIVLTLKAPAAGAAAPTSATSRPMPASASRSSVPVHQMAPEETMSESSSGSYSDSSGSNSDSGSDSDSGSESDSSYASNEESLDPASRMVPPPNGIISSSRSSSSIHSSDRRDLTSSGQLLPSGIYQEEGGLMWSPTKMHSPGVTDQPVLKSPFTSPSYPPGYSSPSSAFTQTYQPSLSMSSPASGSAEMDAYP